MSICKSTQEEIKAGFLVEVISQGRLLARQMVKGDGKVPFRATCIWEHSRLE